MFTNRLREADDVLTTALKGFAPTPEFPAVAEVLALQAELSAGPLIVAEMKKKRNVRSKLLAERSS
jgi:hypothetical protein